MGDGARRLGLAGRHPVLEFVVIPTQDDDLLDARHAVGDCVVCRSDVRPDEDDLGRAVGEDIRELVTEESEVDDHVRRADGSRTVGHLDGGEVVHVDRRHSFTAGDAKHPQRTGDALDALGPLSPRVVLILVADTRRVRLSRRPSRHRIRQQRDRGHGGGRHSQSRHIGVAGRVRAVWPLAGIEATEHLGAEPATRRG